MTRSILATCVLLALVSASSALEASGAHEPAGDGAEGLTPFELAIWNEPSFRKRFAESYIAETDIEPRVTDEVRASMQEVLVKISNDQLPEARAVLDELRGPAANAVIDFTLGNIEFQQERFVEAAAAYRVAVDKYPKFRRAWNNLGQIHVMRGEYERAAPALTRVIQLGGGDALTYGMLGLSYSNLQQFLAAESAFRMAVLLEPTRVEWKVNLALAMFKQERYHEVVAIVDALLRDDPTSTRLWLMQANAYIGLRRPLDAARNFEMVDTLGASSADSLNTLGDIYVNEELFDLAAESYLRALDAAQDPTPDRALRSAKALTARGATFEARRILERIEQLPEEQRSAEAKMETLRLRARLALAEGAGDEEARVLEELVALDPTDGDALILLGQHSRRQGDPEQAVFYFERAAGLEAFEADARLRHAELLVSERKYAEAVKLLKRSLALRPRDSVQNFLEKVEQYAAKR